MEDSMMQPTQVWEVILTDGGKDFVTEMFDNEQEAAEAIPPAAMPGQSFRIETRECVVVYALFVKDPDEDSDRLLSIHLSRESLEQAIRERVMPDQQWAIEVRELEQ